MKKGIVPRDSRYIPLTQQKSCCVPTCVSMIMYKNKIPLLPMELLGHYFGLIVSPENKKLFWNARTGEKPLSGYGTRINLKRYEPNSVFKKLKIPLKMVIHSVANFTDKTFVSYIAKSVKENKDIMVCFNSGVLNNQAGDGHVCVIDRVYPSKNEVRIIDPSYNKPKWRMIKINKLRKAMEMHPANGGAFWELIKTSGD